MKMIPTCLPRWALQPNEQRQLKTFDSLIDYASNDYLGFSKSPELHALFLDKMQQLNQMGATASRLVAGNHRFYEELEGEIAHYHHQEAALLFPSGYLANLSLISTVAKRDDWVLYDQNIHASTRDGIFLSHARAHSFQHNDLCHLESLLNKAPKPPFVCIESVYSTDGSVAPLQEISILCQRFEAKLIIDEAHATGVFGPGLATTIPSFACVYTFGKALGVQGGAIIGSALLKEFLISHCRPFIYSTALSYPHLIAIEAAYELLKKTSHSLPAFCNQFGLKTPIDSIHIGDPALALEASEKLKENRYHVGVLRHPTVPRGKECLRVTLHTFNNVFTTKTLYELLDHYRH